MLYSWKRKYLPLNFSTTSKFPVNTKDETVAFIPTKTVNIDRFSSSHRHGLFWLSIVNIIAFFVSIILFFITFYEDHRILNAAIRQVSTYSPIHDQYNLNPQVERVNGTFFPSNEPSIARQFPNEVADKIWDEWELRRIYPVTRKDLLRMAVDVTTAVKLENFHWGLGNDAYAASWDVYHQLHCLNHLRKMVYTSYYNMTLPRLNPENPTKTEIHTNHCVDILMQALQCSGNVNLISLHWVETQSYPFPNFSIQRQCVDFEGLTEWRKKKSLNMDKWVEVMKKPEGVNQLPMADAYYNLFSKDNPNHVHGANPGEDFNL